MWPCGQTLCLHSSGFSAVEQCSCASRSTLKLYNCVNLSCNYILYSCAEPQVRWVCGTSRVNKLYDYRETYSAPLSPLRRKYVRWMNTSWWECFTRIKKKAVAVYLKKKRDIFSSYKNPDDPQLLIDLVLHCCSVVIMTRAVVIIILCCNKPIRWAFHPSIQQLRDTWLSYSVLQQA